MPVGKNSISRIAVADADKAGKPEAAPAQNVPVSDQATVTPVGDALYAEVTIAAPVKEALPQTQPKKPRKPRTPKADAAAPKAAPKKAASAKSASAKPAVAKAAVAAAARVEETKPAPKTVTMVRVTEELPDYLL